MSGPETVIHGWIESMGYYDMGIEPESLVAALEANGYVVLPRPEFDALRGAIDDELSMPCKAARDSLASATRAVVEAAGPTKEGE